MKFPSIKMPSFKIPFLRPRSTPDDGTGTDNAQSSGIPTPMRQMQIVYMAQLKLYMKGSIPFLLILLVLMIPAIIYTGIFDGMIIDSMRTEIGDTGETFVAICLSMLSAMTILVACILCGSTLPSEIRYRTAYLNFPFPQSRTTFYFGKFLAGYSLTLMTVLLAFGISIVTASLGYGSVSFTAVGTALIISIAGSFAICAMAYGISAYTEKGSTMIPFALIFIMIPVIALVLADAGALSGYIGYIPSFFGEVALSYLGSDQSVSMVMLLDNMNADISAGFAGAVSASMIFGVVFLFAGLIRTQRREI